MRKIEIVDDNTLSNDTIKIGIDEVLRIRAASESSMERDDWEGKTIQEKYDAISEALDFLRPVSEIASKLLGED